MQKADKEIEHGNKLQKSKKLYETKYTQLLVYRITYKEKPKLISGIDTKFLMALGIV